MAAGVWTMTEIRRGQDGERFEWTADTSPPSGARGGGRCAPLRGWTIGGQQRKVRTNYPGARTPSTQVLGPVFKPQTINGKLDDRYNYPGFAVEEMRRLEAVCERGSFVRMQFQDQAFIVLIDDWDFDYRRDWDIGYTLTLDVQCRSDEFTLADRSPPTVLSVSNLFDDVDMAIQSALEIDSEAPRSLLAGDLGEVAAASVTEMAVSREALGGTLDNRELIPPEKPTDGFTRLATQFRQVQAASFGALVALAEVRADVNMVTQTVMGVLDFETWSRSLRFAARIAFGSALLGDRAATERADPDAIRLYRPQEGESLYSVARKHYGTPHAWRLIYDRNALTSVTLTGDEILIIPERG